MQPGQMAYDRGITVFSPDGRLFQVEYAREAVKKGATTIGVKFKGGVLLAVDKRVSSKLVEPDSIEKIYNIDDYIGCATSGLVADARILVDQARKEAQIHRVNYGENIGVEMLLPTAGMLAGVGAALMLYSLVLALGGDVSAIGVLLGAALLAAAVFALIVKRLPSSRLWRRLVLKDASTSRRGFVSAPPRESLVGKRGVVRTELRPAGTALIDGRPVDVVSEGAFLPKGTAVRVIAVEGMRVVVRREEETETR